MQRTLNDLERLIIAALQIDGRATWRKIATVLEEPERTVARHGAELLSSGVVTVAGMGVRSSTTLLRLECSPGTSRVAAEALAQRPDTTYSYLMTGGADAVAELNLDPAAVSSVLTTEIPATVGLVRAVSYPVLRYFRTIRGWRSGLLTDAQSRAMDNEFTFDGTDLSSREPLSEQDERIIAVLVEDGRASLESIARRVRISETTAGRRVDWLLRNNRVTVRTLVEPAAMGLPVEAFLWIRSAPSRVEKVGQALALRREVRYAAAVAGDYQLVANVTVPDTAALYSFITDPAWADDAYGIDSTILLQARKRGGRLIPHP
ncbi:Lrp/AsnC family transcriptional regulator [Paeniglutamicibacter cryotolerans]|uniref:Lrp/AsnC family transcriptional regulator for asnA, asnC and gidA n=1 Tax=Paeniglutamicibacter cryotolerans TaxID=670079 RepID=A0A839QNL9_9MICC|nr:AsnC family transcriptional regulator [Paeniglutamicibacter cryotolerans]MBB2995596.1 Lrp/AsnC family transcriptional regulator for asnA, asnC and gidA [Paeniglutamicibacter cryotolerans]